MTSEHGVEADGKDRVRTYLLQYCHFHADTFVKNFSDLSAFALMLLLACRSSAVYGPEWKTDRGQKANF